MEVPKGTGQRTHVNGPPTNLPLRLTSFVGREQELDHVDKLMSECRLVTLSGAGGCGKSRLAIEFAERAGALLQFMSEVKDVASLCYFNYAYSGERVGRALVGMEFDTAADHQGCLERIMAMPAAKTGSIRAAREVSDDTFLRLTGKKRVTHEA